MKNRPSGGSWILAILLILANSVAGLGAGHSFEIPILLVRGGDEGKVGTMEFSLRRNAEQEDAPFRVSLSEDYAMGTQEDAVASVWMAAMVASALTGKNLTGYELTARFTGATGGPSAGGVYCLAILAALNHKSFPDDVVMTGTIMPDGGIGPIGGLPYKLVAAKKAGFRRAIIPTFSGLEEYKDPMTGDVKSVDPVEFGKSLGLEIYSVETIDEAYEIAFDTPIQKEKKGVHPPVRYSSGISSALRSDRDALLSLVAQTPEERKEFIKVLAKGPEDFRKEVEEQILLTEAAKDASLVSVSHYRASVGVPLLVALRQTIQEAAEAPKEPSAALSGIDKTISDINSRIQSLRTLSESQTDGMRWQEMQLMPDIETVYSLAVTSAAIQKDAKNTQENDRIYSDWFAARFYANWIEALCGQQFPFAHTVSAIKESLPSASENLDEYTLDMVLQGLISAGRVNAKTAQKVGSQRVEDYRANGSEFGIQGAALWSNTGSVFESRLAFIEELSKQGNGKIQQKVRACLMASDILAESAATYAVFETIGTVVIGKPKASDTEKTNPEEKNQASPMRLENRDLAGHLINLARKRAEAEVGALLVRYPDAVLPIYHYELAESFSQGNNDDPDNVFSALSEYYKAYLTASLMDRFMDIQEGGYR